MALHNNTPSTGSPCRVARRHTVNHRAFCWGSVSSMAFCLQAAVDALIIASDVLPNFRAFGLRSCLMLNWTTLQAAMCLKDTQHSRRRANFLVRKAAHKTLSTT